MLEMLTSSAEPLSECKNIKTIVSRPTQKLHICKCRYFPTPPHPTEPEPMPGVADPGYRGPRASRSQGVVVGTGVADPWRRGRIPFCFAFPWVDKVLVMNFQ